MKRRLRRMSDAMDIGEPPPELIESLLEVFGVGKKELSCAASVTVSEERIIDAVKEAVTEYLEDNVDFDEIISEAVKDGLDGATLCL